MYIKKLLRKFLIKIKMRLKLINFKSKIKKYIPIYFLELRKKYWADGSIDKFSFDKELNVKDDIKNKYNYNGDLLRLFGTNKKFTYLEI
jgi:hypothetical protein